MDYDTLLKKVKKGQKKKAKEYNSIGKDAPKKIQKQIIKKKVIDNMMLNLFYDIPKNI